MSTNKPSGRKKIVKWIKTRTFQSYMIKFAIRIAIFLFFFIFYLWDKQELYRLMMQPVRLGITPVHVLWVILMGIMIHHIFPSEQVTMAMKKAKIPVPESWAKKKVNPDKVVYKELELLQFVQDMNQKAWKVLLVWLCGNGVVGLLYLLDILQDVDLFMITVFFFLSDYICILVYCPFQSKIMKNRCCVNCRIYDWGHFMMFTPMLFIKNFFSWSLFFTSCVVLIRWEIIYAKHPERFWYGSNERLQCKNCQDRQCQLKKRLGGMGRE